MGLVSIVDGLLIFLIPVGLWMSSGESCRPGSVYGAKASRNMLLGGMTFLIVTPLVMVVFAVAQGVWVTVWSRNPHPVQQMLEQGITTTGLVIAYISAVVFAPAAEELMFRGVIQWLDTGASSNTPPEPAASLFGFGGTSDTEPRNATDDDDDWPDRALVPTPPRKRFPTASEPAVRTVRPGIFNFLLVRDRARRTNAGSGGHFSLVDRACGVLYRTDGKPDSLHCLARLVQRI